MATYHLWKEPGFTPLIWGNHDFFPQKREKNRHHLNGWNSRGFRNGAYPPIDPAGTCECSECCFGWQIAIIKVTYVCWCCCIFAAIVLKWHIFARILLWHNICCISGLAKGDPKRLPAVDMYVVQGQEAVEEDMKLSLGRLSFGLEIGPFRDPEVTGRVVQVWSPTKTWVSVYIYIYYTSLRIHTPP